MNAKKNISVLEIAIDFFIQNKFSDSFDKFIIEIAARKLRLYLVAGKHPLKLSPELVGPQAKKFHKPI